MQLLTSTLMTSGGKVHKENIHWFTCTNFRNKNCGFQVQFCNLLEKTKESLTQSSANWLFKGRGKGIDQRATGNSAGQ